MTLGEMCGASNQYYFHKSLEEIPFLASGQVLPSLQILAFGQVVGKGLKTLIPDAYATTGAGTGAGN